ncbi:MAG: hypothetical protein E7655_00215 [Ruminococcaceae bacterium]|nr:hypothetical protein [Oscillospiraceae bacterium]
MKSFLTFDVGTTAMKCVLFDESFNKTAFVSREYSLLTPAPDIVEIDPQVYWDTFVFCVKEIAKQVGEENMKRIAALTFTTQGETLIPVDTDLKAIRNAIVWIDARADKQGEAIKKAMPLKTFYARTGLSCVNGALPLAKLMWIKENEPEIYNRTYKFLLLEDYLIARLTGQTVSEKSLLSSTGWFDINEEAYLNDLLTACGIDKAKLPDILPCGQTVAHVSEEAAAETGLFTSTVVTTGAMDQVSSAVGAGNVEEGIVTETTGTALVIGATSSHADYDNPEMLTIYKHFDHGFLYMPFCNTAGIVLKWFKDNFLEELTAKAEQEGKSVYGLVDEYAEQAAPGSNGVILLPHFAGKGVPNEIENACGVLYGLTLATKKSDVTRAVLEGVGYMLHEVLLSLEKAGVPVSEVRSLGGGSYSRLWGQIKADICQKTFIRMNEAESTSLGAAILGYCAVTDGADVKTVASNQAGKKASFSPNGKNQVLYAASYSKYLSLYEALKQEF